MFSGAQVSLYPMTDDFVGVILGAISALEPYRPNIRIETDDLSTMDEIYGCIAFLKDSGVFDQSKNFCTELRGDAGAVFATLSEAFLRFGAPQGHVALDLKVSANSPTAV